MPGYASPAAQMSGRRMVWCNGKEIPIHPAHFERLPCWVAISTARLMLLPACGNGTSRTQHPVDSSATTGLTGRRRPAGVEQIPRPAGTAGSRPAQTLREGLFHLRRASRARLLTSALAVSAGLLTPRHARVASSASVVVRASRRRRDVIAATGRSINATMATGVCRSCRRHREA